MPVPRKRWTPAPIYGYSLTPASTSPFPRSACCALKSDPMARAGRCGHARRPNRPAVGQKARERSNR
jgi:hypothetical protein